MFNIVTFIIVYIMLGVSNGSAMSLIREDNQFGIKGTNHQLLLLPKYQLPNLDHLKVATLNQTGFMKSSLDIFSQKFIEYSASAVLPVLEIGAAYGAATLPALRNNATIIANDIDERHLTILYRRVPPEHLSNLYLKLGHFPANLDFPKNCLAAVLICRVAHFLTGDEIELGLKKVHEWLAPGGKLFFISMSPYHHILTEKFLPLYKKRLLKGEKWPGIINNMKTYNPTESKDIPDFLHVFDEELMQRLLSSYGFEIEEMSTFDYVSSNDKGYLGFIAIKPSS